ILSAGRHLLNLINEVLDISRIEAGTLQLSVEPVCLEEAIGEALDLMRPLAAERTIALAANCSLDTTTYVLADRQRLKQVLLDLPQSKSPLQTLADSRSESASAAQPAEESRRILYIEDNFSNVTLVDQMLAERPALELMTAMQGRVGLELARQHAPDLILLDLHLPDMPGWQVLAQLKADQLTREIPVVIISADATSPQIKRLLSAGARAYLTKPIDIAEFFRVIEEALGNALKTEEAAA